MPTKQRASARKKKRRKVARTSRARFPKSPPKKAHRFTTASIIEAIRRANGFISDAARILGCHPQTVRAYAKDNPEVAAELHEAREGLKDIAEARLIRSIKKGHAWAICFFLKTQAKDRGYIEKAQVEVANVDEMARAIRDAMVQIDAATDAKAAA